MRKISDILKTNCSPLLSITPNSSVYHAIKQMADRQIEALPVIESGRLVGIIGKDDCVNHLILIGKSAKETWVWEIMAPDVIYATPDQYVENCLAIMTEKHIPHLAVIENGNLIGFVSLGEVLRTIIADQKEVISRLINYSGGKVRN